jgi:hypothetical protein
MGLQASTAVRNAMLDAIETAAGTSAKLEIFTGAAPASCSASEVGTKLVEFDLASTWAAAASGASKSFNNEPLSNAAVAGGTAGHFRLYASDGVTCHLQGTVTATGGGGDMTVDNTNIASAQVVNVTSFAINASMA